MTAAADSSVLPRTKSQALWVETAGTDHRLFFGAGQAQKGRQPQRATREPRGRCRCTSRERASVGEEVRYLTYGVVAAEMHKETTDGAAWNMRWKGVADPPSAKQSAGAFGRAARDWKTFAGQRLTIRRAGRPCVLLWAQHAFRTSKCLCCVYGSSLEEGRVSSQVMHTCK